VNLSRAAFSLVIQTNNSLGNNHEDGIETVLLASKHARRIDRIACQFAAAVSRG
jgi:hypothetical protein